MRSVFISIIKLPVCSMNSKLPYVVPFLVGLSSVISLYSSNSSSVHPKEIMGPSIGVVVIAAGILAVALLMGLNRSTATVLSTSLMLLITSYGHVYDFVEGDALLGIVVGRHRILIPALFLIVFGIPVMLRKWKALAGAIEQATVIGGIALFLLTLSAAIPRYLTARDIYELQAGGVVSKDLVEIHNADIGPDIYYIILDGHGRADVLDELYGYDDDFFYTYLESRGFYIASQSRANYVQTALSLASSLNMQYVDEAARDRGMVLDRNNLDDLVRDNRVANVLQDQGYKTIAFETGFRNVEMNSADYYLQPPIKAESVQILSGEISLTPFEGLYLDTTLFGKLWEIYINLNPNHRSPFGPSYEEHRARVEFTLEMLPAIARRPGSYFIVAHVISPHPPFMFDKEGDPVNPDRPFTFLDGSEYMEQGTRDEYIEGYREQIQYLQGIVIDSIEGILSNSETTPIIILQADHGPGAYLVWDSPEESKLWERVSILNAYLVPDSMEKELYPSITPVNSFRIILPGVLGGPSKTLLQDVSYYSNLENRFTLIPVPEDEPR